MPVEIDAGQCDGWGAWATAPLFLLPLLLSLVIGTVGVVKSVVQYRRKSALLADMVFTVIAGIPLLWLVFRRHIV